MWFQKKKKMVLSKVKREEQSLPHPPCRSQETQAVFPLKNYSCQKNLEQRDQGM